MINLPNMKLKLPVVNFKNEVEYVDIYCFSLSFIEEYFNNNFPGYNFNYSQYIDNKGNVNGYLVINGILTTIPSIRCFGLLNNDNICKDYLKAEIEEEIIKLGIGFRLDEIDFNEYFF